METVELNSNQLPQLIKSYHDHLKFFVRGVLGWDNQPFHDELDDDISQNFDKNSPGFQMIKRFFAVFTYPRDHGKSSHLSIAYPLDAIAKNHNELILIISKTSTIAESFLSSIVTNIERNEKYKEYARLIDLTGKGVVPRMKHGRKQIEDWSGNQITIDREDNSLKDPTICATGLFGQILSKRATTIILDDVVDQGNSATELQRK